MFSHANAACFFKADMSNQIPIKAKSLARSTKCNDIIQNIQDLFPSWKAHWKPQTTSSITGTSSIAGEGSKEQFGTQNLRLSMTVFSKPSTITEIEVFVTSAVIKYSL